ncbi:hypothetical protein EJ08DRAFT_692063 [Tothia fuscella]|uniref:Uncharacterized protein n=1 Tax=Tothia fuscella TaxID=1048955 RepID=A0A9P4P0X6_9PEZI|nr:hypothetical protein EJ08DRAFT_692063 [Tothia fuscella]
MLALRHNYGLIHNHRPIEQNGRNDIDAVIGRIAIQQYPCLGDIELNDTPGMDRDRFKFRWLRHTSLPSHCMAVSVHGIWYLYFGLVSTRPKLWEMDLDEESLRNSPECDEKKHSSLHNYQLLEEFAIITSLFASGAIYFGLITLMTIIGLIARRCKRTFLRDTSSSLPVRDQNPAVSATSSAGSVLGNNGRIFFPSQLLPIVSGAWCLCLSHYIRLEKRWVPGDSKPSLTKAWTSPNRNATIPCERRWLKYLPPCIHRAATGALNNNSKSEGTSV